MKKSRPVKNVSASVRQRLQNRAKESGEALQTLLTNYAVERWMYRLSLSPYANDFVLKGAQLFSIWTDQPHRFTRDLDLLGSGEPTVNRLEEIGRDVCATKVASDDGIRFLPETVRGERIREGAAYEGVRLILESRLERARIPVQVDIGFGDAVVPEPEQTEFPTLLDFPAPRLRAYPRETVVAEKFQAMVMLGSANSRMKDFYDLWFMAQWFSFDGTILARALKATFERRTTDLPSTLPVALGSEFADNPDKQRQWQAFWTKSAPGSSSPEFSEVVATLARFLMPVTSALVEEIEFAQVWAAGGTWERQC